MDEKIGRRGLLKMVAGTVAGAIGASALAEKVAAQTPQPIPMRHGQQLQTANVSAMGVYTGTATAGLANNVTISIDSGDGVFVNGHEWGVGGGQVIPTNFPDYDTTFPLARDDDGWYTPEIHGKTIAMTNSRFRWGRSVRGATSIRELQGTLRAQDSVRTP